MRAITVRPPYGWAILNGKSPENRSRNIAGDYRGPVVIHQGKRPIPADDPGRELIFRLTGRLPLIENPPTLGAALGVAELVDVHSATVLGGCGYIRHDCPEHGTCRDHCSPWAYGPNPDGGWFWHLVFIEPRWFPEPIPYRGALGLWHFPDELLPEGFR